ncbi:hypothetical protein WICPIJ_000464 [Wickerhamomyces pijperi]|uniref:WW domain-containing protein n=1 Tax=Wickerhamomyces pijperi TaxID=599730 RepID=A0A9P8QDJ8_WICPI|nr:hypothetical protein WICPIJ_000464 [Wickerhamomyces pijperi]
MKGIQILPKRKKSTTTIKEQTASLPNSKSGKSKPTPLRLNTSNSSASLIRLPEVEYPWEVRYDSNLGTYYYCNVQTKECQFDHPEEVAKSPKGESNSKVMGSKLKRTLSPISNWNLSSLSPKFSHGLLNHSNQDTRQNFNQNQAGTTAFSLGQYVESSSPRSISTSLFSPTFQKGQNLQHDDNEDEEYSETDEGNEDVESYKGCNEAVDTEEDDDYDEDMVQFKKLMIQEMKSYDNQERLRL